MYKIDKGIAMPKLRRKSGTMPKPVAEAILQYKTAYRRLYGIDPIEPTYKDGFVYLDGASQGIALKILRSRIKQLKYRKG